MLRRLFLAAVDTLVRDRVLAAVRHERESVVRYLREEAAEYEADGHRERWRALRTAADEIASGFHFHEGP